jgi:hypothetical protein
MDYILLTHPFLFIILFILIFFFVSKLGHLHDSLLPNPNIYNSYY